MPRAVWQRGTTLCQQASLPDKVGGHRDYRQGPSMKWKVEREKENPALSCRSQDVMPCPSGGASRDYKSPGGKLPGLCTKHTMHCLYPTGNAGRGWREVLLVQKQVNRTLNLSQTPLLPGTKSPTVLTAGLESPTP